jgi:hypothetical protein
MTVVNTENVHEISAAGGGLKIGNAGTEKISLYGKTPIIQQTAPTLVTSVNPTTSGSALVASIHSIAVYAASTVNVVVQDLIDLGVYA